VQWANERLISDQSIGEGASLMGTERLRGEYLPSPRAEDGYQRAVDGEVPAFPWRNLVEVTDKSLGRHVSLPSRRLR
jgi:hypothetical protein